MIKLDTIKLKTLFLLNIVRRNHVFLKLVKSIIKLMELYLGTVFLQKNLVLEIQIKLETKFFKQFRLFLNHLNQATRKIRDVMA